MKIAIITGASSGMGREFARQITTAEQFDEIWVIARRADRLEALKNELPCPVRPLALHRSADHPREMAVHRHRRDPKAV